jgi:hypothetical protein
MNKDLERMSRDRKRKSRDRTRKPRDRKRKAVTGGEGSDKKADRPEKIRGYKGKRQAGIGQGRD